MIHKQPDTSLLQAAEDARAQAYAPYSAYLVGAAILDECGRISIGCNVENAAYPLGNCAETSAIAAMISAGGRKIREICILGGQSSPKTCTPCGGCRQRIHEFATADTIVWVLSEQLKWTAMSVETLLPASFTLSPGATPNR